MLYLGMQHTIHLLNLALELAAQRADVALVSTGFERFGQHALRDRVGAATYQHLLQGDGGAVLARGDEAAAQRGRQALRE